LISYYRVATGRRRGVGSLEPLEPGALGTRSPEPGAQSLFLLEARTEKMILAKWNPKVQPWSPGAPIFLSWSPRALNPLGTPIQR